MVLSIGLEKYISDKWKLPQEKRHLNDASYVYDDDDDRGLTW